MIVKAEKLIEAIEAIDLVPSRSGIVPSEFIQIEKIKNKLYFSLASEVFGKTWVKGESTDKDDWIFHCDRSSLVPFIQASKIYNSKAFFNFDFKDKKLSIRTSRRKVVFNAISFISGYPVYKDQEGTTLALSKTQKTFLQLAAQYASPDPTIANLNCAYVLRKRAVLASNRITLLYIPDDTFPLSIPLPLVLLGMIDNKEIDSVEVSKNIVKLKFNCGYICQAVNSVARRDFPSEVILNQFKRSKKYPVQFKIKSVNFLKALSRLHTYISSVVSKELIVNFEASKNDTKLKMFCKTPQGVFTEYVGLASKVVNAISCELLLTSIIPLELIAKKLGIIEVRYDDTKTSPYHFITAYGVQVIMSRRVNAK